MHCEVAMNSLLAILFIVVSSGSIAAQVTYSAMSFSLVQHFGKQVVTGTAYISGQVKSDGRVISCRGGCELTSHSVVLRADVLTFDRNTGIASARGNVSMTFEGVRPPDSNQVPRGVRSSPSLPYRGKSGGRRYVPAAGMK